MSLAALFASLFLFLAGLLNRSEGIVEIRFRHKDGNVHIGRGDDADVRFGSGSRREYLRRHAGRVFHLFIVYIDLGVPAC